MTRWLWIGALLELAAREWRKNRAQAAKRKARAKRPIVPRACPRCEAFLFVPDQLWCGECGATLDP